MHLLFFESLKRKTTLQISILIRRIKCGESLTGLLWLVTGAKLWLDNHCSGVEFNKLSTKTRDRKIFLSNFPFLTLNWWWIVCTGFLRPFKCSVPLFSCFFFFLTCLCSCLLGPPASQGAPLLECRCCHCHTCTTHRPSFLPLHSVSPGVQVLLFPFLYSTLTHHTYAYTPIPPLLFVLAVWVLPCTWSPCFVILNISTINVLSSLTFSSLIFILHF